MKKIALSLMPIFMACAGTPKRVDDLNERADIVCTFYHAGENTVICDRNFDGKIDIISKYFPITRPECVQNFYEDYRRNRKGQCSLSEEEWKKYQLIFEQRFK